MNHLLYRGAAAVFCISNEEKDDFRTLTAAASSEGDLAGGGGFEPPLMDSESTVLPLDYPPVTLKL
jgi:hypothetical protein